MSKTVEPVLPAMPVGSWPWVDNVRALRDKVSLARGAYAEAQEELRAFLQQSVAQLSDEPVKVATLDLPSNRHKAGKKAKKTTTVPKPFGLTPAQKAAETKRKKNSVGPALREVVEHIEKYGPSSNQQMADKMKITMEAIYVRTSSAVRAGYIERDKRKDGNQTVVIFKRTAKPLPTVPGPALATQTV